MKKRFISLAVLCSTVALSSNLFSMKAEVLEEAPAIEVSSADICKEFSKRLKMSVVLLEGTETKLANLQTEEELTEQAQTNRALIQEKLPAIIANIKSVRTNLKVISPDSLGEWLWKQVPSIASNKALEEADIVDTSIAQLQAVKLFIQEFKANLTVINDGLEDKEALHTASKNIEDTLNAILTDIKEVKDVVAPRATVGGMLMSIFSSFLSK